MHRNICISKHIFFVIYFLVVATYKNKLLLIVRIKEVNACVRNIVLLAIDKIFIR